LQKEFTIGAMLGTGNYAEVKVATEKATGVDFAVKIIDKAKLQEEGDEELLELEVAVLEKIDHPNITKLHRIFDSKSKLYLVIELVEGGELLEWLIEHGAYTESEASGLFRQMAEAMEYLHGMGIAHRDLKPENLLLAAPGATASIKITDFGFAKLLNGDSSTMYTSCGTPEYVAPEVLRAKKEKHIGYGAECDIWSLGVILYIMLCGYPPFYEDSMPELFRLITKAKYSFPSPEWDDISDDAKDLIRRMLQRDPEKRITAAQCLEHPWVASGTNRTVKLEATQARIRAFQARKKFKRGVNTLIAGQRFKTLFTQHNASVAVAVAAGAHLAQAAADGAPTAGAPLDASKIPHRRKPTDSFVRDLHTVEKRLAQAGPAAGGAAAAADPQDAFDALLAAEASGDQAAVAAALVLINARIHD